VRDREIVVTIRRGTLLQRPRGRKKRSCDLSRKRKLANLRIEVKDPLLPTAIFYDTFSVTSEPELLPVLTNGAGP
jgi:hypothetical protein